MNSFAAVTGPAISTRKNLSAHSGLVPGRPVLAWIAVALLFAGAATAARAQSHAANRAEIAGSPNPKKMSDATDPLELPQAESITSLTPLERQKLWDRLDAGRRQSISADVGRLLQLAGKLSSDLGEPGSGAPSQEELRTIREIQKLARKVKENMAVEPLPE